ncbi:predicted protein [Candida tropicalis MYA-3404]|uniref:Uncharacterized protein n=1 Tax=Candida tropicalis (strain ATCC MYA-3404 / T1) TaxID=294747 RepID=C5M2R2_CANTT|nr:predicted protein [Candida tropicalis MYA-3404]EER35611.1 predicted protein [Candida tropicalis MYA-3404]KAG4409718.1 hypothetical protein JTP64_000356 [Candida tropicalis]
MISVFLSSTKVSASTTCSWSLQMLSKSSTMMTPNTFCTLNLSLVNNLSVFSKVQVSYNSVNLPSESTLSKMVPSASMVVTQLSSLRTSMTHTTDSNKITSWLLKVVMMLSQLRSLLNSSISKKLLSSKKNNHSLSKKNKNHLLSKKLQLHLSLSKKPPQPLSLLTKVSLMLLSSVLTLPSSSPLSV